jgi:hypothetical protein
MLDTGLCRAHATLSLNPINLSEYKTLDSIHQPFLLEIQTRMIPLNHISTLFRNHMNRVLYARIRDNRENTSVDDTKVAHTVDLETSIDDAFVDCGTHSAGTTGIWEGGLV